MVQDIGMASSQRWWEHLHEKKHETLMKDIGQHWFMKAATKWESSIAKAAMDLFGLCELFKDTLVVSQWVQIWWIERLFPTVGKSTSTTGEFRGIFNPFWGVV